MSMHLKYMLMASALIAAPAMAQDRNAGQNAGLQDIVVTAQRREENLQKAALAVSAVAGDTLVKQSVTQATDLSRLVPALQVAPAASFTQIYMRGIGSFGANAFAEQGVAFNLDGIYLSRPAAPAALFYDLERIEALKGPQGTLYGRNASGGALNVITAKPKLGETSGFVNAEYGNYNAFKSSAAVNLALGEQWAARLSGQYARHDGYMSDGYDDENTGALRGQVKFDNRAGINATLMLDYGHVGGKGSGGTIMPLIGNGRLGPSDPAVVAAYLGKSPTAPVPQITAKGDGFQDNSYYGAALTANADLGFATLTVIPAWRKTDLNFLSYASSFLIRDIEKSRQGSVEARLANRSGAVNWVAGAYWFNEHVDANQRYDQGSNGLQVNSLLDTQSLAAFGQATVTLAPTFRVTGGLRYTDDRKQQATNFTTMPFVGFVSPGTGNFTPIFATIPAVATTDIHFRKATWKAGVEYDVAPRSLLYASVATGFKSGALYAASGQNYSAPENLTAYTIGSKNRFLDNRLQLNVEAFWWDYRNQQISHLGPVQVATTPGGAVYAPVFLTENAGGAKLYGIEAEVLFKPTPNDLLTADIQWLHARYKTFGYYAYSSSGATPAAGCAVSPTSRIAATAGAAIFSVDCSGRPLVNAPDWTINLAYEHKFDLAGGANLTFGADTRIQSASYVSIDYLPDGRQGAYTTSNARLAYEPAGGRYTLTAFVNNIEDTKVFSASFQSPVKNGVLYNQLRAPRTFGIRGSLRF
ncbi:iron complex outermembrane receptor protein [Novosphingobium sediminicola]|uniref:Iron complex outermembrane receptor protein n=2 Tax=Novosphingobium sediminicola TaxID=563162 RepID=A0A7W6CGT5_9SPHN|nr:iron complex outermembrane receptor protein [Novosphingobium sediminicola]